MTVDRADTTDDCLVDVCKITGWFYNIVGNIFSPWAL